MASSMQKGLDYLLKFDAPIRWFIMLCDMPFVIPKLIEETDRCTKKDRKKESLPGEYSDTSGYQFFLKQSYFKSWKLYWWTEGAKQ